jgi:hypothetical protein
VFCMYVCMYVCMYIYITKQKIITIYIGVLYVCVYIFMLLFFLFFSFSSCFPLLLFLWMG